MPIDVISFLKKALRQIEHLYDEKAVILLGNTGCGKSTMISSLVFGPHRHEMRNEEYVKKVKNGKEKPAYRKVID